MSESWVSYTERAPLADPAYWQARRNKGWRFCLVEMTADHEAVEMHWFRPAHEEASEQMAAWLDRITP